MSVDDRSATLAEVVRAGIEAAKADLHTCLPAIITAWDPATQLADVKPVVRQHYLDEDMTLQSEQMPVIPSVPVVFPRTQSFAITFPVAVGDRCLLIFSESSTDRYLANGGTDVDDPITRRHALDDAFALIGGWPNADKINTVETDAITIGHTGVSSPRIYVQDDLIGLGEKNPSEFVALATKVLTELQAIVAGFNAHTHSVSGAATLVPSSLLGAPSSVAATTVKAK